MDFRASPSPYRFAGLKGPWKFTGSEDAGSDRFAINIAKPPSKPLAGTPVLDFLPSGRGRSVQRWPHPIAVATREQRPHHSCVLVGQGHDRIIGPASELKPAQPDATRVAFALGHACGSACPVDEQRAQVTIAALADAEQHRALAAGALARHQPQPGAELAAVGERPRTTDRRDHSRRHQRTDAFDFNQPPTPFVLLANARDPLVVLPQTVVEHPQPLGHLAQKLAQQPTQAIALVLQDHRQSNAQPRDRLCHYYSALTQ